MSLEGCHPAKAEEGGAIAFKVAASVCQILVTGKRRERTGPDKEMESWCSLLLLSFLSLSFSFLFKHLHAKARTKKLPLPPAASPFPVLSHLFIHRRSKFDTVPILRRFHSLHGPIISLRLLPFTRPSVFISDASISHSALVQHGSAFASRPTYIEPMRFITVGNRDISSSPYGTIWRLLRRNLSSGALHPSRLRLFSPARSWAVQLLSEHLRSQPTGQTFIAKHAFQYAIFSLLVLMCFGEKLSETEIREIESPLTLLLNTFTAFNVFAIFPEIAKVVFRERWEMIVGARRREAEIYLPLIRARQERKQSGGGGRQGLEYCYADSLLDVRLPEEGGRGLSDDEMVNLCHEFLSGGIDTTTTALEWTMAEVVKHPSVQAKLSEEIELIVLREEDHIKEEDLQRMPYLKAVIMESLRRHPPGHYLFPHEVTEDVVVNGFLIPKGTEVHFAVADVNWDGKRWEEPMEFRPERFIARGEGEGVDITGSREIKMLTFGAGRRMCPGYGIAILHLEILVANLVKEFEWKSVAGEEVDLSEKLEFTTVMKNPLRVQIFPRRKEELRSLSSSLQVIH